jgi:tetratricopeptide (TPR) repeat protein
MQDFDFEASFSSSQQKSYVDKLSAIANSNPTNLADLFDLVVFYLEAHLGSEALVAYRHLLKLSSQQDSIWPQSSHDMVISRIIEMLLAHRFHTTSLPQLESLQSLLQRCKEMIAHCLHEQDGNLAATAIALLGRFFKFLKYDHQAEQLFVGALALNPLCELALRDYAHLLLEKGQFTIANKYLRRIDSQSRYYTRAKLDIAWLQELSGSTEEMQILKDYATAAKHAANTTIGATAVLGIGHYHHLRGNYAKAKEMYQSSLYKAPTNALSYFFMATLPLFKSTESASDMSESCTRDEIDACYRRGLSSQSAATAELRYLPLFAYGQFLVYAMQDLVAGEAYLEAAAKLSLSTSVWPSIALAQHFQYNRINFARGKLCLMHALEYRLSLLTKASADSAQSRRTASDDYSVFKDAVAADASHPSLRPESDQVDSNQRYLQQIYEEIVSLHLALGHLLLDMNEDVNALKHARDSLKLAVDMNLSKSFRSTANRLLGIIAWKHPSQRRDAYAFFENSMLLTAASNVSGYSLRQGSIVYALKEQYELAYNAMEAAVVTQDRAAVHPLTWKALSLMSYLYKASTTNAIAFMFKSSDLSDDRDVQALLLLAQMLLEADRYDDAIDVLRRAIHVAPTHAILWAHLAIALRSSSSSSKPAAASSLKAEHQAIDHAMKLKNMSSLRQLSSSTIESDEAMFVAMKLLERSLSGAADDSTSIWSASHYNLSIGTSSSTSTGSQQQQQLADCIFICAVYFCNLDRIQASNELSSAHRQQGMRMLRQLVEDEHKSTPYPMAACLLGWMHEIDAYNQLSSSTSLGSGDATARSLDELIDLSLAHKYYDYCANCCFESNAVDALTLLRVKSIFEERCQYLRQQVAHAEKYVSSLEHNAGALAGSRRANSSAKSRLKQRMLMSSTTPSSSPWMMGGQEQGDDLIRRKQWLLDARQRVSVWKKRLELSEASLTKLDSALLRGHHGELTAIRAINPPKRYLTIPRDWLQCFMESFSCCEDWAAIRKSLDTSS